MQDFNLNLPTEIIFGKDKENEIGNILAKDGIKRVLLVYGTSSIKSTGLHSRILAILKKANIDVIEYSGIKSNPRVSDVDNAALLGRDKSVEAVLAVGGGSVMDSAKAIAAAIKHNCGAWDFYTGTAITQALPIYNIVTLAATASEMNSGFVLTNDKTKEKMGTGSPVCYPRLSILNPELTFTVPPNYTAFAAVDIIAHTIEGYLTATSTTTLLDSFNESIIKSVIHTTEQILQNPEDYDARAEFMWSATMALNGTMNLGREGVAFPNHMIEHGLSGVTDIPHGAGLSIIIPAWMKWYKDKNSSQFHKFVKNIFNKDNIEEGIKSFEKWLHSLGSPIRLSEYNIHEDKFETIKDKAFKQATMWGMDKDYTEDVIMEILELAK